MTAERGGLKKISAAIYLRLSGDDKGACESTSIRSQRRLLMDYAEHRDDLKITAEYCDDGYSGVDFSRPDFLRMLGDIYAGKISCVIVKDFSRLGRDYIETGRFIQSVFPSMGVRFIAVAEGYDSLYADTSQVRIIVPFKNFINESYCRDISLKVRAVQKMKRLEGSFAGAFAPYGYKKQGGDRQKLIPDAYASYIVQKIFILRISGMSLKKIADNLEACGTPSPLIYKKLCGENYFSGFSYRSAPKWTAQTVKRILDDRVYTGSLCQGKTEKINYKLDKRIYKNEDEWQRVDNAHEAVVSEIWYSIAGELKSRRLRAADGEEKVGSFLGIVFCGDCGEPVLYRRKFLVCRRGKNSLPGGCAGSSIREDTLSAIVFKVIEGCFDKTRAQSRELLSLREKADRQLAVYENFQELICRRADWLKRQKEELLNRFETQKAEKWEYDLLRQGFEAEYEYFRSAAKKHKAAIEKMKLRAKEMKSQDLISGAESADRRLLMLFVKRIEIYGGNRIVIMLRLKRGEKN